MSKALLKSRYTTSIATPLFTQAVISVGLVDQVCFASDRTSWLFLITSVCLKLSSGSICSLGFLGAEVKLIGM